MKVIAYHLPQFHQIAENDKWWGDGFTEWTNVAKARPLFNQHCQPRRPLDDNYYNLLDKQTMLWQSKLAENYGIYGFCYYHYWFSSRRILDKPLENLLKWQDLNQHYCLCWANHSWKRTWNASREVLIEQSYGGLDEWEEHFQYLLRFFKDKRYITVEGRPVVLVYSMKSIPCSEERFAYYDKRAKEYELPGIYLVETVKSYYDTCVSSQSSAAVYREPAIAFSRNTFLNRVRNFARLKVLKLPRVYSYDLIWRNIITFSNKQIHPKRNIGGTFVDWDNTPRHGRNGSFVETRSLDIWKKNLDTQRSVLEERKEDMIFINAWNEWAECMYLEPDTEHGYRRLEIIREVFSD